MGNSSSKASCRAIGRISWLWGLASIFVISCSSERSPGPAAPPPTAAQPAAPVPPTPAAGPGPASAKDVPAKPAPKPAESGIISLPDLPGDQDAVVLFPNGTMAATCGQEGKVQVYQLPDTVVATFEGIPGKPRLAIAADGRLLAQAADQETRIKVWNVETKQEFKTLEGHQLPIADLAFSPDGGRLASVGRAAEPGAAGEVKIWSMAEAGEPTSLSPVGAKCVAFSPDGKYLASAGTVKPADGKPPGDEPIRGETTVWDLETRQAKTTVVTQRGEAFQLAFSPDGGTLAIAERDGPHPLHVAHRVRLVAPLTGQQQGVLVGHLEAIHGLAFSPDGQFLLTAAQDQLLRIWQVPTQSLRGVFLLRLYGDSDITFSRDGARLALAAQFGGSQVQATALSFERALQGEPSRVGWEPFPIRVLNTRTPAEIRTLALSADGLLLATSTSQGMTIYDTSSWRSRRIPDGGGVQAAAFSPDLMQALVASETLKLWSIKERREVRDLGDPLQSGGYPSLLAIAFSPDGKQLASSHFYIDRDGIMPFAMIRLRDLQTGQWLAAAANPETQADSLAFSADGTRVAAACSKARLMQIDFKWRGEVSVWDTQLPDDPQVWRMQSLKKSIQREVPAAVQEVFGKAYRYYREGKREEIVAKTLQPVAQQLAEIKTSSDPLDLHWQQVTLNTKGAGIDAVRFRIPAGEPVDLMWTAVMTQDIIDCRVIPAAGPLPDVQERFVYSQQVAWTSNTYEEAFGRLLEHPAVQPGQEYILWFALRGDDPIDVRVSVNLLPKGKFRERGWGLPLYGDPEFAKLPLLRRRGLFFHGDRVDQVALSPDGRRVASVGRDGLVKVWDVESGALAASYPGHLAEFSPDGKLLATDGAGEEAASVVLWDAASGSKVRTLTGGHFLGVCALAFSRDGQRLASGGHDGWVTLWNPQTGEQLPAP